MANRFLEKRGSVLFAIGGPPFMRLLATNSQSIRAASCELVVRVSTELQRDLSGVVADWPLGHGRAGKVFTGAPFAESTRFLNKKSIASCCAPPGPLNMYGAAFAASWLVRSAASWL